MQRFRHETIVVRSRDEDSYYVSWSGFTPFDVVFSPLVTAGGVASAARLWCNTVGRGPAPKDHHHLRQP